MIQKRKETTKSKKYHPVMKLMWNESIRAQMEKWKDTDNEYYRTVLGKINICRQRR